MKRQSILLRAIVIGLPFCLWACGGEEGEAEKTDETSVGANSPASSEVSAAEGVTSEEILTEEGTTAEEISSEMTGETTDTTGTPPQIISQPVTEASANEPYSYTVIAEGTPPITFSLLASPTGMSIDATTGLLMWTPTIDQVGDHPVSIRASNAAGEAIQSFTAAVTASAPQIISEPVRECLVVGIEWTYQPKARGTPPITWSLVIAPEGAMINPETGLITWTPTAEDLGGHEFVIRAANEMGEDTLVISVCVVPTEPVIVSEPPTTANVGEPYIYEAIAFGILPLSWVLEEAPEGMTLEPFDPPYDFGILVTWTPTEDQKGENLVILTVLNDFGIATQSFTITVQPPEEQ